MGLQEQRLALVVLLDGSDLGEKLLLDVLGQVLGFDEFGGGEAAVHDVHFLGVYSVLTRLTAFPIPASR